MQILGSRPGELKRGAGYMLLRDPLGKYSGPSGAFATGAFKSYQIGDGSIGIWMARLWKREVQAALLAPGWQTPWDLTPVVGISKKLGYHFFRPNEKGEWVPYEPPILTEKYKTDHDVLVLHRNDVDALLPVM